MDNKKNTYTLPTKDDLRKVPSNETIESAVVNVEVTSWLEILGAEKLLEEQQKGNFEQAEKQVVVVVKTDSNGFLRDEKFYFFNDIAPTNRSKYGKYVERYGVPVVGQKVFVDFDNEGKSTILLAK